MVPRRPSDHLGRLGVMQWWLLEVVSFCLVSWPRQAFGHVECRPLFGVLFGLWCGALVRCVSMGRTVLQFWSDRPALDFECDSHIFRTFHLLAWQHAESSDAFSWPGQE